MKFNVTVDGKKSTVEGREAYPVIKRLFTLIGKQLLFPQPPHTTKVRRFAREALRRGEPVSDGWSEENQPNGQITMRMVR